MAHFRVVTVAGKEYQYKVGRHATFIKDVGYFSHQDIGYCVDVSMDVFKVSPQAIRRAIIRSLECAQNT